LVETGTGRAMVDVVEGGSEITNGRSGCGSVVVVVCGAVVTVVGGSVVDVDGRVVVVVEAGTVVVVVDGGTGGGESLITNLPVSSGRASSRAYRS
jgi:hypothetical protein